MVRLAPDSGSCHTARASSRRDTTWPARAARKLSRSNSRRDRSSGVPSSHARRRCRSSRIPPTVMVFSLRGWRSVSARSTRARSCAAENGLARKSSAPAAISRPSSACPESIITIAADVRARSAARTAAPWGATEPGSTRARSTPPCSSAAHAEAIVCRPCTLWPASSSTRLMLVPTPGSVTSRIFGGMGPILFSARRAGKAPAPMLGAAIAPARRRARLSRQS